jgi:hypothetical protein
MLPLLLIGLLVWRAAPDSFQATERARLRVHFAVVERELLARDVSALSSSQRAARADLIVRLRNYSGAGRFPRNEHFPDTRVPYFRDAHGTLCAMAYLIASTGSGNLVDRVARTRNNAYLPELADEPGLVEWLDAHGLLPSEAARIQPTYGPPPTRKEISSGFAVASGGLAVANGVTAVLNLKDGSKGALVGRGFAGIAAGGLGMALGISHLEELGPARSLGVADLIVGGISAALGVNSLIRAWRTDGERPQQVEGLAVHPVVRTAGGRQAVGIAGRLTF